MKLKKHIVVRLEDKQSGIDGVFTFKKAKANEIFERELEEKAVEGSPEALKQNFDRALSTLIKVEGVTDEDGNPVGVEEFKSYDVPRDIMIALIIKLGQTVSPPETAEKKESASA